YQKPSLRDFCQPLRYAAAGDGLQEVGAGGTRRRTLRPRRVSNLAALAAFDLGPLPEISWRGCNPKTTTVFGGYAGMQGLCQGSWLVRYESDAPVTRLDALDEQHAASRGSLTDTFGLSVLRGVVESASPFQTNKLD